MRCFILLINFYGPAIDEFSEMRENHRSRCFGRGLLVVQWPASP